jgi:hypothetical protein
MKNRNSTAASLENRKVFTFSVSVKLEPNGADATREPILATDLADIRSEAWLVFLRSGHPVVGLEDLRMTLLPVWRNDRERVCRSLIMEAAGPEGHRIRFGFDIQALAHVADRASKRLVQSGILKPGGLYYFSVIADQEAGPRDAPATVERSGVGRVTVRHAPLVYRTVPLPSLLAGARVEGSVEGSCPVFYTETVFREAEIYARRGADGESPEESGGVILGCLCSCPESGEFFVVATDVIEVRDADRTGFTLTYSSETWRRIQAVVRARQADPRTRSERIVGQCHGHNFLPDYGAKKCETCEKRPTCVLTSVFVSEQDLLWSKSVFVRQPWAFCHIFGLDARGEPTHGQFGFREGRLVRRGFYRIDDFPADALMHDRGPGSG